MYNDRIERYLKRYGATLATVAALGGVGVASAEANSGQPAVHIESLDKVELPKSVPDGVKRLISQADIQKDVADCLPKMNRQLNAVIVLHDPMKENAQVSFATSPRSYVAESADFLVTTNKNLPAIYRVIPRPAIVTCDKRDYAVISDAGHGGAYGFLDLKFAEETGAIDIYAFKGSTPKVSHRTYSSETNDLPVVYSSEYYEPQWMGPDNKQILTSIVLPTNLDPHRKTYKLTPSKFSTANL